MKELLLYWNVTVFRARTVMRAEAARTYLNFLWWLLDPLLTMAIFYFVFAMLLRRGTENYVVFLIVGLVVWQWFGNTVGSAAQSIQQSGSLINQIRFPKVVLPLTVILANTYKFLFVTTLMIPALWFSGFVPTLSYLALPALILLQLLLIYGVATILASLIPIVPDLQYVLSNFLRALMFLSGIFYPASVIPENFQTLFWLNPMASIVDAYRQVLIYGQWPDIGSLANATVISIALAVIASVLISILNPRFARLIVQR